MNGGGGGGERGRGYGLCVRSPPSPPKRGNKNFRVKIFDS